MKTKIFIIALLLMFFSNIKSQEINKTFDFLELWEKSTLENITVPSNIKNREKTKERFEFYIKNSSLDFIKHNEDSILGKQHRLIKNVKESRLNINLSNSIILEVINEKKHEFFIVSESDKRSFTFRKSKKWKLKKSKQINYNNLIDMYASFSPKVDCDSKKENITLFGNYSYLIVTRVLNGIPTSKSLISPCSEDYIFLKGRFKVD